MPSRWGGRWRFRNYGKCWTFASVVWELFVWTVLLSVKFVFFEMGHAGRVNSVVSIFRRVGRFGCWRVFGRFEFESGSLRCVYWKFGGKHRVSERFLDLGQGQLLCKLATLNIYFFIFDGIYLFELWFGDL